MTDRQRKIIEEALNMAEESYSRTRHSTPLQIAEALREVLREEDTSKCQE